MNHPLEKRSAVPIAWVDVCKGLGISLVVLGHTNVGPVVTHCIYLFHMPLFFFLSGYLHRVKTNLPEYLKKKSIHLLVPYVSFLLLLYPVEIIRVLHRHGAGPAFAHVLFAGAWGGSALQGLYGVFWFLPCLFLTQQVMNFLLVKNRLGSVTLLVLLALILSYANAWLVPHFSLPLDANVVLAAVPFFYIGYRAQPLKVSPLLVALCALAAFAGGYLVVQSVPVFYDMRMAVYGIPGLSLLIATNCIFCLIAISKLCTRSALLHRTFGSLGAASMGIMFIHKQLPIVPALARLSTEHAYLATVFFLSVSLVMTRLLHCTTITRALLLGSEADFNRLKEIVSAGVNPWPDHDPLEVVSASEKWKRAS